MDDASNGELRRRKIELRATAHARRRAQADRAALSRQIADRLWAQPEYAAARTLLAYVAYQSEVHTRELIAQAWADGKRVVLPDCHDGRLRLFQVESFAELEPGTLGILEPRPEVRGRPEREANIATIDLVLAPGVAFDRRGGRLGHGKGYYDRLLAEVGPQTCLIGLAFECQVFDEVPLMAHDVPMHKVITERAVWAREDRQGAPARPSQPPA